MENHIEQTGGHGMGSVAWQRSSFCSTNACVEVLHVDGVVLIRNSSGGRDPVVFTRAEWSAFLAGVRAGEFTPDGGSDG